jgi:hypothetical protein
MEQLFTMFLHLGGGEIPHIFKDDYYIPITIRRGLPTIKIRKPTKEELYTCETIILTSEEPWNPENVMKEIKYQKKNVEPPRYYNGADMCINPEYGYWQISAKTYITNTCEKIEKLFEVKLKNYGSPMETGDHPEMDQTDLLDPEETTKYQMLVGCAQWAVSLGRYDIQFATNLMARFAHSPRTGHMKRMFRLFGYLKSHAKYRIVFDPTQPNYEGLEFNEYDWSYTYQDAKEDIPDVMPEPFTPNLGITVYADSNHGNCLATRRSTTSILLTLGKTPIFTYSKRQNTIESSTYGAEFFAARTAIEKIVEYR